MQVVSRRRSEVRVPWLHNLAAAQDEDHDDQTDTEGEETEEEEESDTEESKLKEVRGRAEAEWGPQSPTAHQGDMKQSHGMKRGSRPPDPETAHARSAVHCTPRELANKVLPCPSLS